jgi:hypothetical protein
MSRLRLLALAWPLLAACTAVVRPPASPVDPVEAVLLDHGRTSSLVVPDGDGRLVRWAYGDWHWYALEQTTPARAVAALFWPTRGALGRQELAGPPGPTTLREEVWAEIEAAHPIAVGRAEAAALAARLDELFRSGIDTVVVGEGSGLSFVHHPHPYTLLHSSNRRVAAWLRELGCDLRGPALLARWRLRRPPGPPAAEPPGGRRRGPARRRHRYNRCRRPCRKRPSAPGVTPPTLPGQRTVACARAVCCCWEWRARPTARAALAGAWWGSGWGPTR